MQTNEGSSKQVSQTAPAPIITPPPPHQIGGKKHIVLIVHGMNDTGGSWFGKVRHALTVAGLDATGIGFDKKGPLSFLYTSNQSTIDRVLRQFRSYPSDKFVVSVIAHSFGCWLTAKALADNPDIRLHKVIFCGSVVDREFRWDQILNRNIEPDHLINDCGTHDYLPLLATIFTRGYGPSGTFGFSHAHVNDRFHDFGHSGFLTDTFASEYWADWLVGKPYKPSEWDRKRPDSPWYIPTLSAIYWLRWPILVLALLIGIFVAYFVVMRLLTLPIQYERKVSPVWRPYSSIVRHANEIKVQMDKWRFYVAVGATQSQSPSIAMIWTEIPTASFPPGTTTWRIKPSNPDLKIAEVYAFLVRQEGGDVYRPVFRQMKPSVSDQVVSIELQSPQSDEQLLVLALIQSRTGRVIPPAGDILLPIVRE